MTAKERKEAMRTDLAADLRRRLRFLPANEPTTTSTKAFETACGPLGPEGCSLMENTAFSGFSAGRGGIMVFGGLAAIFAELEFLDFSTGSVLRPKGQRLTQILWPYVHSSLRNKSG
jgi:hypothetical protein